MWKKSLVFLLVSMSFMVGGCAIWNSPLIVSPTYINDIGRENAQLLIVAVKSRADAAEAEAIDLGCSADKIIKIYSAEEVKDAGDDVGAKFYLVVDGMFTPLSDAAVIKTCDDQKEKIEEFLLKHGLIEKK